jgi:hypothetical protein
MAHGAYQVWEVPSICSSGREVKEYMRGSQDTMRTQVKCCGEE